MDWCVQASSNAGIAPDQAGRERGTELKLRGFN